MGFFLGTLMVRVRLKYIYGLQHRADPREQNQMFY